MPQVTFHLYEYKKSIPCFAVIFISKRIKASLAHIFYVAAASVRRVYNVPIRIRTAFFDGHHYSRYGRSLASGYKHSYVEGDNPAIRRYGILSLSSGHFHKKGNKKEYPLHRRSLKRGCSSGILFFRLGIKLYFHRASRLLHTLYQALQNDLCNGSRKPTYLCKIRLCGKFLIT